MGGCDVGEEEVVVEEEEEEEEEGLFPKVLVSEDVGLARMASQAASTSEGLTFVAKRDASL